MHSHVEVVLADLLIKAVGGVLVLLLVLTGVLLILLYGLKVGLE